MSKKWKYTLGVLTIVITIGSGVVLLLNYHYLTTPLFAQSAQAPAWLAAERLLFREEVIFYAGPFLVAATPFQLIYFVLAVGLICLAVSVCLAKCLFCRWRSAAQPGNYLDKLNDRSKKFLSNFSGFSRGILR